MTVLAFKKLPGVLSFQRLTITTDASMFNRHADGKVSPLRVVRHGIRGTQNINNDKTKEVNNIQITETAKTASDATGVQVRFGLRFLPLNRALFACAGSQAAELRSAVDSFIDRSRASTGLAEVARRYARNIFNGRWLWRNRLMGRAIQVRVFVDGETTPRFEQDALATPLRHFNEYTAQERGLAEMILAQLEGREDMGFQVEADIDLGLKGGVEMFPSQNYIEGKPSGFARPLYKLDTPKATKASSLNEYEDIRDMGQAALRDQKIGNALRTIDTWFPDYPSYGQPIAVEPNGASLDAQRFFRAKENSAFSIMRKINGVDPSTEEGMFLIASLVRGGVYSESEKDQGKKKDAPEQEGASGDDDDE